MKVAVFGNVSMDDKITLKFPSNDDCQRIGFINYVELPEYAKANDFLRNGVPTQSSDKPKEKLPDAIAELRRIYSEKMKQISERKEEILEAFVAKYGCQPDELEIIENKDLNTWGVQIKKNIDSPKKLVTKEATHLSKGIINHSWGAVHEFHIPANAKNVRCTYDIEE